MKTPKVLILVGLPGSGKSTYARQFCINKPSYVRVNRNDFRLMFKDSQFCDFKLENTLTEIQNETIMTLLQNKHNVIIDNTHVKMKCIQDLINLVKFNADISFKLIDTNLIDCIERDKKREKSVGEKVILDMHANLVSLKTTFNFEPIDKQPFIYKELEKNISKKDAYIFDIDGTIAHTNGKRDILDYAKVIDDDIDVNTVDLLRKLAKTTEIIFLTGREESCKHETLEWIMKNNLPFTRLFMRPEKDFRKDTEVKAEIYEDEIKNKWNILGVFEDRVQVCKMWHKLGLKVYQVNQRKF